MCSKNMRKILFFLCLFIIALNANARDVNVTSGDATEVMNLDNSALIEFDYTNLKIDGVPYKNWLRSQGRDFVKGWDSESESAAEGFINNWNDENKTGMYIAVTDEEKAAANYKIVVTFTDLNYGNLAKKIIFGGGRAKGSGNIKFYRKDSSEPFLTVEFKDEKGGNQYKWSKKQMRKAVYSNLGKEAVEVIQDYYKKGNK